MANTLNLGTDGNWAVKKDSLLGYNSENGNYKPLPFDFTRASSATVVNKAGLIETVGNDIPRIDYSDDANGALLLEPQRTNLYTYSNDVSFWTKSNVITTSDYAISPDGTQNAFRAVSSSISSLLYITSTGIIGTDNTLSVWAKSNGGSSNKFRFFGNGTTIKSNDYVATNEWQRFEFTYNCTSVTSGLTGASDSATNDILFYGFQHEDGSYATSYIPTQGSAVTRLAESCSQTVPSGIIGQTEGTVFLNLSWTEISTNIYYVFNDGTSSNRILIYSTSESEIFILIQSEGITSASFSINGQNTRVLNKIAVSYKNNDFKVALNGVIKGTYTSGNVPLGINFIDFFIYGQIAENKLYNTALTDSELQALTTI